jgi:dsDNA-specific endonuclease/ATPase MutS2
MLTVVHGLGTGRLKEEIHQILTHTKEVDSYRNVHHPLFGFGATEVFFRYI